MRPTQRKLDILAALVWALLAAFRLALFLAAPSALQAGQFLFTLIMAVLFVIRRPAKATASPGWFWFAVFAAFLPALALRASDTGLPTLGAIIQHVALVLILLAIMTLNRSFGLAPAHRGLVTRGIYRWVRHPLYAGEILSQVGYCIGYVSTWNWVVLAVFVVAQVLRLWSEERLLSADHEYQTYQQRVRWRLLPGIW